MKIKIKLLVIFLIFLCNINTGAQNTAVKDFNVNEAHFKMLFVNKATFPIQINPEKIMIVEDDFYISETVVTYDVWYNIRLWAEENNYSFMNKGREGRSNIDTPPSLKQAKAVSLINLYDAIVFCNALSDFFNYQPVYLDKDSIIKNADSISIANIILDENANGFRLPFLAEWELCYRLQSSKQENTIEYPPHSSNYWQLKHTIDFNNVSAEQDDPWKYESMIVGLGEANHLGLYDMEGLLWEWCFTPKNSLFILRGGNYQNYAAPIQNSDVVYNSNLDFHFGLRIVKNVTTNSY